MKRLIPSVFLCAVLGIMFIDGCAVHRIRPARMNTQIPEAFNKLDDGAPTGPLEHQWWLSFDDPMLNQIMEITFEGNLDLVASVARLQQAVSISRQRTADQMPYVNAGGSAARSQQLGTTGEQIGRTGSYSLTAGYEVDLWRKLSSRSMAQKLAIDATVQDLQALYLTLSAQVAENYYLMVERRATLKLIDQTIAARSDNLELVELRYREGMVSALDLYQARQNLANAKARRPDVEAGLATTAHALGVLTGGYPTTDIGGTLDELPDVPETFPLGLPSDLLQQRPDIQSAILRLEAQDHQIVASVADRFPSINLLADYGHSESDFGTLISGTVWNLLANLTLPLIDFQKRKSEVDRNRAIYTERLAEYQQVVLSAFQEVEDALVANRQSKNAIAKISAEVSAAEDALRLSKAEYKDGLSTYLPVLTAQTTYFDSKTRLLSARRQLISARISLAKALGGNWMENLAKERMQAKIQQP